MKQPVVFNPPERLKGERILAHYIRIKRVRDWYDSLKKAEVPSTSFLKEQDPW